MVKGWLSLCVLYVLLVGLKQESNGKIEKVLCKLQSISTPRIYFSYNISQHVYIVSHSGRQLTQQD